jgi:hypothetical protein
MIEPCEPLRQPRQRGEAEALLQQAMAQAPDNPDPLTLFAVLRPADLQNDPGELRVQVEPLLTRLLMLRRQTPGTKPADLALALELDARLLDQMARPDDALPLKTQAQGIRRGR